MKRWAYNQRGFTVVELLIVIVVIAILAAISVVAYNGVQNRSYDSTVKSDLNSMYKQLNVISAESGSYELPDSSNQIALSKFAYRTDINNIFICINRSENKISLTAASNSGKHFQIIDGAMSESGGPYYAASTCSLVDVTDTNGNYQRGWTTGSPGSWAGWIKS